MTRRSRCTAIVATSWSRVAPRIGRATPGRSAASPGWPGHRAATAAATTTSAGCNCATCCPRPRSTTRSRTRARRETSATCSVPICPPAPTTRASGRSRGCGFPVGCARPGLSPEPASCARQALSSSIDRSLEFLPRLDALHFPDRARLGARALSTGQPGRPGYQRCANAPPLGLAGICERGNGGSAALRSAAGA